MIVTNLNIEPRFLRSLEFIYMYMFFRLQFEAKVLDVAVYHVGGQ